MKTMKFVPGFAALTLACATTVGSMYVTLSAAAENEAASATVVEETEVATDLSGISLAARLSGRISTISDGGVLSPASGVSVSIAPGNGTGMVTASTDAEGVFALGEVGTGAYTLTANSSQGLLTYGVVISGNALAERESNDPLIPVSLDLNSQDIQLNSTLVPAVDVPAVKAIVGRALGVMSASNEQSDETAAIPVSQPVLATSDQPTAYAHEQVQLNANGSLDGVVRLIDPVSLQIVPVNDLRVHLVSEGVEGSSARVNRDGSFTIPNVLPGIYAMVAAGTDGIAASGIDVVGNFADLERSSEFIPTSTKIAAAGASTAIIKGQGGAAGAGIGVGSGNGGDGGAGVPGGPGGPGGPFPTGPAPFVGGGFPGGGFPGGGGGFAGGGGGFGGGGGLGALLGIGAAAGIAAAIADNNNDRTPASP
ncbi:MAG: hypothetical protein R3C19_05740 [Planctomycetaceae bacterium]